VDEAEIARRRVAMDERGSAGWVPTRKRAVSTALRAYGMMTTSAARGAVRDLDQLVERHKL
jgi:dihydroxy-acid dehydratase